MTKAKLIAGITVLLCARGARAHEGAHPEPLQELPRAWTYDPWLSAGLGLMLGLYVVGFFRLRARAGAIRAPLARSGLAFGLGWLTLIAALLSPLDALSERLFSAHMSQHELLMLVAAPLLVYAQALRVCVWALPPSPRAEVLRWSQTKPVASSFRFLTAPLVALLLHGFVRWVWHVPLLFEAALESEWIHGLQHATFFVTAMFFWWALVNGRYGRLGYGMAVLFVFATALHTGALGALIALAREPLYPSYQARAEAIGASAVEDQQLAGLIMWVGAGMLFMMLGLALFLAWIGEAGRRAERSTLAAVMRERARKGAEA